MSIQAAQRRRAGPTSETMAPGRGPQPSINSAQMFANQARPGQGPSMPTGRLAGQQVEQQQKQQQQQQQQKQQSTTDGLSSVSKMTIAQAITLITLRLGNIESKMINLANLQETQPQSQSVAIDGQEMVLIDTSVLQSITSRLESLEKRYASVSSGPEMNLLKQQFETVKQTLIQTKSSTVQVVKDNKDLKTQVENLKQDLLDNRHLLNEIQKLAMSNSNKILEISINLSGENEAVYNCQTLDNMLDSTELSQFNDFNEDSSQNELVGTNLKELIENELNSGINIIDDEPVSFTQSS